MADRDIQALGGMDDPEVFDDEDFGFHAQQAAEKAFKAWLCLLGLKAPRTHDLDDLVACLTDNGQPVSSEAAALVDLTDFAVGFRYSEMPTDTALDRDAVRCAVTRLWGDVRGRVTSPDEGHPSPA